MKTTTKEIRPDIFAVVVPDDYERGMLFWRAQEFYESPNRKFRDSPFSVWDYARWYAKKYRGSFSYPADFVGFNLPLVIAKKCYEISPLETPYDRLMKEIVDSVFENGRRQYIIGVESTKGSTFEHEIAHAMYYTNLEYRNSMDKLTGSLSESNLKSFKKNIKKLGYYSGVVKDEIQAYMSTEISDRICRGVRGKKELHKRYRRVFKSFG